METNVLPFYLYLKSFLHLFFNCHLLIRSSKLIFHNTSPSIHIRGSCMICSMVNLTFENFSGVPSFLDALSICLFWLMVNSTLLERAWNFSFYYCYRGIEITVDNCKIITILNNQWSIFEMFERVYHRVHLCKFLGSNHNVLLRCKDVEMHNSIA